LRRNVTGEEKNTKSGQAQAKSFRYSASPAEISLKN